MSPQHDNPFGRPPERPTRSVGEPPDRELDLGYSGRPLSTRSTLPQQRGAYQPVSTSINGLAIASMVLGILWIYWIGSILAIIFGLVAMGQIKRSTGRQSGRGMAIAGLVLGLVGVGILLLVIIAAAAVSSSG